MAYLVDLDEEEQEVPSTLLRSVYDTQADQSNENINADNLLINVIYYAIMVRSYINAILLEIVASTCLFTN
jgi:hypothetical protein